MANGTPVMLTNGGQDTSAVLTQVTATFNVTAGDVILAVVTSWSNFATAFNHTVSSTTMTIDGAGWQGYHRHQTDAGGSVCISTFLAKVTATQTGRTITFGVSPSATKEFWRWGVARLPGASAIAKQNFPSGISNGAPTTHSITLSGLVASSMVIGCMFDVQDDDITPGAGWTELFDSTFSTGMGLQFQYSLTPATPCNWSTLIGGGTKACIALEIEPEVVVSAPTVLTSGGNDAYGATQATGTFNVTANDMILAVACSWADTTTVYNHTLSSTTMTVSTAGWQAVHEHQPDAGGSICISTFSTRAIGTQTGRTITFGVSPASPTKGFWLWAVVTIPGVLAAARQSFPLGVTNQAATTLSIPLTGLVPGSLVIGAIFDVQGSVIDPGSGWTELFDSTFAAARGLQIQYDATPVSPCDWSNLTNAATKAAIALEFEPVKIRVGTGIVDSVRIGTS